MSPDEIRNQVANYHTLGLTKSARGIAALFLVGSVVLTLVFVAIGFSEASALLDVLLFIVLAVFVYLGHRWAMIGGIALWTFEKVAQLVMMFSAYNQTGDAGGGALPIILWWVAVTAPLYKAYKVEQVRRRPQPSAIPASTNS